MEKIRILRGEKKGEKGAFLGNVQNSALLFLKHKEVSSGKKRKKKGTWM